MTHYALIFFLIFILISTIHSQQFEVNQAIQLTSSTEQSFGESVVLSNDKSTLVISAPEDGLKGSVFVYKQNSTGEWSQVTKLSPTTALNSGAYFGGALAVSSNGSVIVVGAPGQTLSGTVFVFFQTDDSKWEQFTTITYKSNFKDFGSVVDVSFDGSVIAVSGGQHGYVCVYSKITFGYNESICLHSTGSYYIDTILGLDVKVSGDGSTVAFISTVINTGSVQLYEKNADGEFEPSQFIVVGPSTTSLAFSGDGLTLAVGSSTVDLNRASGSIFYYYRSTINSRFFLVNYTQSPNVATSKLGYQMSLNEDGSVLLASNPNSYAFSYSLDSDEKVINDLQTFPNPSSCFYWAAAVSVASDSSFMLVGCPQYGSSLYGGVVYAYISSS